MKTIFLISAILMFGVAAQTEADKPADTPYGICPLCDSYGNCKRQITYEEAVNSIESYYSSKGMKAVVRKKFRRFLEADIYKSSSLVDRVLMDRKTGRIRSIYY